MIFSKKQFDEITIKDLMKNGYANHWHSELIVIDSISKNMSDDYDENRHIDDIIGGYDGEG